MSMDEENLGTLKVQLNFKLEGVAWRPLFANFLRTPLASAVSWTVMSNHCLGGQDYGV